MDEQTFKIKLLEQQIKFMGMTDEEREKYFQKQLEELRKFDINTLPKIPVISPEPQNVIEITPEPSPNSNQHTPILNKFKTGVTRVRIKYMFKNEVSNEWKYFNSYKECDVYFDLGDGATRYFLNNKQKNEHNKRVGTLKSKENLVVVYDIQRCLNSEWKKRSSEFVPKTINQSELEKAMEEYNDFMYE